MSLATATRQSNHAIENDDDLQRRVQDTLGNHVRHFRLERRREGLVLHGRTRTYYAKQLAQQIVMGSSAERIFANEIEVA